MICSHQFIVLLPLYLLDFHVLLLEPLRKTVFSALAILTWGSFPESFYFFFRNISRLYLKNSTLSPREALLPRGIMEDVSSIRLPKEHMGLGPTRHSSLASLGSENLLWSPYPLPACTESLAETWRMDRVLGGNVDKVELRWRSDFKMG